MENELTDSRSKLLEVHLKEATCHKIEPGLALVQQRKNSCPISQGKSILVEIWRVCCCSFVCGWCLFLFVCLFLVLFLFKEWNSTLKQELIRFCGVPSSFRTNVQSGVDWVTVPQTAWVGPNKDIFFFFELG